MSKILLNGLHYESNGAGISKYTEMLIKRFIRENYDVDILIRDDFSNKLVSSRLIFSDKINGSKDRIVYEQLKALSLYKGYDVVHFPDYATPVFYKGPKIATIHDMAMYTMKDKYTKMQILTKNILLKNTVKCADKLICDSEFSKNELIRYYPEAEEKAVVIYCGIEIPKVDISMEETISTLEKYKLKQSKYILYVGTIAPQKNVENLVKAYMLSKHSGMKHKLVISGKKGWGYESLFNFIKENKLEEDIVITGYITDKELEILYRNAIIFTTISLYEGFGFPPLEAIGRNVPVLLSDIEIFRETCGDAAVYCNPNDIKDISNKMLELIDDVKLQQELLEKGKERLKLFNWSKTAKQIYDVYLDVLK